MQYLMYKLFSVEIKYLKHTNRALRSKQSNDTFINMVLCYIFIHIGYQPIIKIGRQHLFGKAFVSTRCCIICIIEFKV